MGYRKDYQAPDFLAKMIRNFWLKVGRRGPDDCWIWTASIVKKSGYGHAQVAGRQGNSHRMAYEFTHGPIPAGMNVCHSCDNPPCCNPKHLFLGPQKKNMEDMVAKGRSLTGEKHPQAKLTWEIVRQIRSVFPPDTAITEEIAADYGVSRHAISRVIRNKTWRVANH